MFDALELELFQRYRLDPHKIQFYRSRLQKNPPVSRNELRRLLREQTKLEKQVENTVNKMKRLMAEFRAAGLCWDNWIIETNGSRIPVHYPFGWDVSKGQWCEEGDRWDSGFSQPRIIESYTTRPDKPQALQVWNRFLIAFRREPKILIRRHGRGYSATFLDSDGQEVHIIAAELNLSLPLRSCAP